MRNKQTDTAMHRRFMSYISYAFSSIIFDIFAYTLSGKIVGLLYSKQNLLFYFPSLSYNLVSHYAPNMGHFNTSLISMNDLLISLPIITFLAGIFLQKIISVRFQESRDLSEGWNKSMSE